METANGESGDHGETAVVVVKDGGGGGRRGVEESGGVEKDVNQNTESALVDRSMADSLVDEAADTGLGDLSAEKNDKLTSSSSGSRVSAAPPNDVDQSDTNCDNSPAPSASSSASSTASSPPCQVAEEAEESVSSKAEPA